MSNSTKYKETILLAKKYGFHLVRINKHYIFKNNQGKMVVRSASPSDKRSLLNFEKDLRKASNDHC